MPIFEHLPSDWVERLNASDYSATVCLEAADALDEIQEWNYAQLIRWQCQEPERDPKQVTNRQAHRLADWYPRWAKSLECQLARVTHRHGFPDACELDTASAREWDALLELPSLRHLTCALSGDFPLSELANLQAMPRLESLRITLDAPAIALEHLLPLMHAPRLHDVSIHNFGGNSLLSPHLAELNAAKMQWWRMQPPAIRRQFAQLALAGQLRTWHPESEQLTVQPTALLTIPSILELASELPEIRRLLWNSPQHLPRSMQEFSQVNRPQFASHAWRMSSSPAEFPHLEPMPTVENLDIHVEQLGDSRLRDYWLQLPNLRTLSLHATRHQPDILEGLRNTQQLRVLHLNLPNLDDEGFRFLPPLPQLRELCIHRSQITSVSADWLATRFPQLQIAWIAGIEPDVSFPRHTVQPLTGRHSANARAIFRAAPHRQNRTPLPWSAILDDVTASESSPETSAFPWFFGQTLQIPVGLRCLHQSDSLRPESGILAFWQEDGWPESAFAPDAPSELGPAQILLEWLERPMESVRPQHLLEIEPHGRMRIPETATRWITDEPTQNDRHRVTQIWDHAPWRGMQCVWLGPRSAMRLRFRVGFRRIHAWTRAIESLTSSIRWQEIP
ncbi:leucine-rich repeat domain-containing protein [Tuwongella immobilis]|uniref:Uncharacterized protein n=1 Tax=Tuwongella immobilis TaxID=692036 RepID=A0A6C2YKG7_9BACT|nr:hypothetical protein [Tuwongella immobilis]VIP01412.1 unnamed protein product [Tuwongella immobilis]VTR98328.1 unnamed protein product [Tuwongella immobilis]